MQRTHLVYNKKTTNIQNDFGPSFRRSSCIGHMQYTNKYYNYLYHIEVTHKCTEWIGSMPIPFPMGNVAQKNQDYNVRNGVSH